MKKTLEKIISEITLNIVEASFNEYDDSINYAIKRLGEFVNADRTYIFEYNFTKGITNNTYEWCNEGIEPMIDDLQGISLSEIDWWVDKHIEGQEIYINDVENHHDDKVKEILEPQGVKSLLTVPLFDKGICSGFLGLDSVLEKREYSVHERDVLFKFGKTLMFLLNKIRLEQELMETKNRLSDVLDSQKELICTFDGDANVIYINQSFRKIYGEAMGIDVGLNLQALLNKDSERDLLDIWDGLKMGKNNLHHESFFLGEGNLQRWVNWIVYRLDDSDGKELYQAVGSDVTETRIAQNQLRVERDKLRYTMDASKFGTWEWNLKTGEIKVNDRWKDIVGYGKDELVVDTINHWYDLVHPDDYKKSEESLQRVFEGLDEYYSVECRMKHKYGHWVWIMDNGKVIEYDKDGNPSIMYGTHYDITDTKKEENRIRSIFHAIENSPVMVVITDAEGHISYVNKEFEKITGYLSEEVIGENPRILKSGYHNKIFYKKMWRTLTSGNVWEGQLLNKRKNGETYWEGAQISQIKSKEGTIINYVAIKEDITERLELKKLREEHMNQLVKFSEQVPGAIYQYRIRPDGSSHFPMASDGIMDVYEVTPEEVVEDGSIVFSRIHPDDVERIKESIYESARTMEPWVAEYRVNLPIRGRRWLKGIARPEKEKDGSVLWHGYLADSTDEHLIKERIHESEERLRLAMEATEAGLWDWNMVTNKVNYSTKWKSMLGYGRDEIGDSPDEWKKLWHPDDADGIEATIRDYLEGKSDSYEVIHRLRHKQGHYRWIMTRGGTLLNDKGDPIRWVGTNIDITDKKAMEIKLEESNNLFKIAIEEAERANNVKSQFLANASHEIRTPMNSILGFSYLLSKDKELNRVQRERIDKIITSGEHMLDLINDILDMSKIESGSMDLNISAFNLGDVLDEAGAILFQSTEEKGINFEIGKDNIDYIVRGDKSKIRQILLNLGSNAIKFTENGSVKIKASGMEQNKDNLKVEIEVEDTGDGIPEKEIPRLFDLFYHNSYGKNVKGTGLGLPLSKKFANLMGGDIEVESVLGKGSVFRLTLDLRIVNRIADQYTLPNNNENMNDKTTGIIGSEPLEMSESSSNSVPNYILDKIREYTFMGDVSSLEVEIEGLREYDDGIFKKLSQLLDEFDYDGIIRTINKY